VRTMTGYEYDVADAHAATTVRTWECARRGKRKSHRLQFFFNVAHVITPGVQLQTSNSPRRPSVVRLGASLHIKWGEYGSLDGEDTAANFARID
jgi:hypothetical protein